MSARTAKSSSATEAKQIPHPIRTKRDWVRDDNVLRGRGWRQHAGQKGQGPDSCFDVRFRAERRAPWATTDRITMGYT